MFQIKLLMPRRYSCVPCLMNPPNFDPGLRSPFSWQPQTPEDRMFCLFDKINLEFRKQRVKTKPGHYIVGAQQREQHGLHRGRIIEMLTNFV